MADTPRLELIGITKAYPGVIANNNVSLKIMPGEIAKGLKILKSGGSVDYVGATDVNFNNIGEVLGSYQELEVKGGKFETIKVH